MFWRSRREDAGCGTRRTAYKADGVPKAQPLAAGAADENERHFLSQMCRRFTLYKGVGNSPLFNYVRSGLLWR
ncbi:MAG: hypothetical protein LBK73_02195 [Treponema sp.]|nr:hypothetical protein [Treponema sp.]